jgi:hypothetical protein
VPFLNFFFFGQRRFGSVTVTCHGLHKVPVPGVAYLTSNFVSQKLWSECDMVLPSDPSRVVSYMQLSKLVMDTIYHFSSTQLFSDWDKYWGEHRTSDVKCMLKTSIALVYSVVSYSHLTRYLIRHSRVGVRLRPGPIWRLHKTGGDYVSERHHRL